MINVILKYSTYQNSEKKLMIFFNMPSVTLQNLNLKVRLCMKE
jgi:hypothetical protein